MDCQGEPDETFQDKTDEQNHWVNGYATNCERYLPDGVKLEAYVANSGGVRGIDWRVKEGRSMEGDCHISAVIIRYRYPADDILAPDPVFKIREGAANGTPLDSKSRM